MNSPVYFEIQADNPEKAAAFYTNVFWWEFFEMKWLSIPYWRVMTEWIHGWLMKRVGSTPTSQQGTNAFVVSMEVRSFDWYAAKIVENGGTVALEKFAIPWKCRQGYFHDPEWNMFWIFQPDANAGM